MSGKRGDPKRKDCRLPVKIAIVGGGRACKFFLDLLQRETFRRFPT